MAIIKLGGTVVGVRGTIGGVTYTANGSGPYAKSWAKPVNPKTGIQMIQRGYVAEQIQRWRDLSDAQRSDWASYASDPAQELTNSLGESYYASGFNWFVKINVRLKRAGRTLLDDAPTGTRPSANTTVEAVLGDGVAKITFDADSFNGNDAIIFTRGIPSSGKRVVEGNHRETRISTSVGAATTQISFKIQFANIWGDQQDGWILSVKVYTQDDEGQRSAAATDVTEYDPGV